MPSDDEAEWLCERPVECVTGTHGDIVSHHRSQDNWSHQHGHQQHSTVNILNISIRRRSLSLSFEQLARKPPSHGPGPPCTSALSVTLDPYV